jgi:hypothetical protein
MTSLMGIKKPVNMHMEQVRDNFHPLMLGITIIQYIQ